MKFELVVRSSQGVVQTLRVQALDASAAAAQVEQSGARVMSCARIGGLGDRSGERRVGGKLDAALFARELASLLAAGLGVFEALKTLAGKESSSARKELLNQVSSGVLQGLPLSAAMANHPRSFPPLLLATVSASEQTGDLSTSLERYAQYQDTFKELRDRVIGAAAYPMLLLAVGSMVIVFLLSVVVPKFATLIESTRAQLPWSSRLLMSWGQMVASHRWSVGLGVFSLFVLLALSARHTVRTGARARWVERLPVIGAAVRKFRHAQLYRTTGMLVVGGIPAVRALTLGADLLGADDRVRLRQAVALIEQGLPASRALHTVGLGDPVAISMLAVAERTGTLGTTLERISSFHEAELQRTIALVSRLFEPILMIFIGLVIGGIVVLMYLPIFDLASSLQ